VQWPPRPSAHSPKAVGVPLTLAAALTIVNGLFQHALLRHLGGDAIAAAQLDENVRQVLPALLG
jgi:hypothetical protein